MRRRIRRLDRRGKRWREYRLILLPRRAGEQDRSTSADARVVRPALRFRPSLLNPIAPRHTGARLTCESIASCVAAAALVAARDALRAQQKQRYSSLQRGIAVDRDPGRRSRAARRRLDRRRPPLLVHRHGPAHRRSEIRAYDPATGRDTLLFSGAGADVSRRHDAVRVRVVSVDARFRNLVFQSNFQQLFRRSGTSDFYIYSLGRRSLQLAGKGRANGRAVAGRHACSARSGTATCTSSDLATQQRAPPDDRRNASTCSTATSTGSTRRSSAWRRRGTGRPTAGTSPSGRWTRSKEPEIQLTDYSGLHPEWDHIRIPQPGDTNPTVRIGVARRAHREEGLARSASDAASTTSRASTGRAAPTRSR